ncbi:MAG: FHA domain-containing protein [Pirellulaceae bacterium]
MTDYDVYYMWLGIAPEEQPPHHYRLLGIPLFEQNTDVIAIAAEKQLSHVKRLAVNQYTQVGQRLLDEIATAKLCLLRPEKRAAYDAQLRTTLESRPQPKSPTAYQIPSHDTGPWRLRSLGTSTSVDWDPEAGEQSLIVGRDPSCDIVLDLPAVSGMHCKLVRRGKGTYVKDLRSTNGTYVNFKRVASHVAIARHDWITLGREARLIPPPSMFPDDDSPQEVFYVGRHRGCEIRRDVASVSTVHARIIATGAESFLEDLGSTNGTQVFGPTGDTLRLRPNQPISLSGWRTVSFGELAVDLGELLSDLG